MCSPILFTGADNFSAFFIFFEPGFYYIFSFVGVALFYIISLLSFIHRIQKHQNFLIISTNNPAIISFPLSEGCSPSYVASIASKGYGYSSVKGLYGTAM